MKKKENIENDVIINTHFKTYLDLKTNLMELLNILKKNPNNEFEDIVTRIYANCSMHLDDLLMSAQVNLNDDEFIAFRKIIQEEYHELEKIGMEIRKNHNYTQSELEIMNMFK